MVFSLDYRVRIGKIPKIDLWQVEDRDIERGLGGNPEPLGSSPVGPSFSAI